MKKIIIYPAIFSLLAGSATFVSSCKKKSSEPVKNCKMQRVVLGAQSYLFSYDDQFRVSKIQLNDKVMNFTYSTNQTVILSTVGSNFESKKILTLNDAGLIINARTETNATGSTWTNDLYNYTGNQVTSVASSNSSSSTSNVVNYVWENGNVKSMVPASSSATNFTYYEDQNIQDADYINLLISLQFGKSYVNNKNLVKSFNTTPITYSFNDDKLIKEINLGTSPNNTIVSVEYTCR